MSFALGATLLAIAAAYSLASLALLPRGVRATSPGRASAPAPISVLKPLCGAEPHLEECLESFFRQHHPSFELVFGARDRDDPALAIVERLRARHRACTVQVVVGDRGAGANPKTRNLAGMLGAARHGVILISDSDVLVPEDHLAAVGAELAQDGVGAVTCLYLARPGLGLASRLGASFVNDWFHPAVLFSRALGNPSFASGVTIALERDVLERIGGFGAIADHLADDWALCARVRALGLRTVLSRSVARTALGNEPAPAIAQRELRWLRTIRSIDPAGYALLFLTMPLPLAGAGFLLAQGAPWAWVGLALVAALRAALHLRQARRAGAGPWQDLPWAPVRDALLLLAWLAGFLGHGVRWRGRRYFLDRKGAIRPGP